MKYLKRIKNIIYNSLTVRILYRNSSYLPILAISAIFIKILNYLLKKSNH